MRLAGAGLRVSSEGRRTDLQPGRAALSTSGGSGGSERYEYATETLSHEEMQQIADGALPQSVVIQQVRFFFVVL